MVLTHLLDGVTVTKLFSMLYGRMVLTQDVAIKSVQYDSRRVGRDDLFVAIRGAAVDGHTFIDTAVRNGARVVVVEDDAVLPDSYFLHAGVIKIVVPDTRAALAQMAANFYGHPSRRLRLVGVTGTNGKTTTTHLIKAALEAEGGTAGLIGTIDYVIGAQSMTATHTTPESLELQKLLADMLIQGCSSAVMEVSSHALALHRVGSVRYAAAAFTNLTQDHLDFHGTMEGYFRAKKMLFDSLESNACAVTNLDDPHGAAIVEGTVGRRVTYGLGATADVHPVECSMDIQGTKMTIVHPRGSFAVASRLTGRFNMFNILAACGVGLGLGVAPDFIAEGIGRVTAVRGRFEQITAPARWTAIVDYAHTPDALENCLRAVREEIQRQGRGRVITVFGCGGNRDRGKRPIMGRIASSMSDISVITSDNPRKEDPEAIIDEIIKGVVPGATVVREADRRLAIAMALERAVAGDLILVAGKGHEQYQLIGEEKRHFDDREEIERFIRERG
jgi:UDP-N-acetylmuramoyl-L-alanyl-D-glutamate--2,6-diaminopimelate ligase